jgi:hypothetical protein
VTRLARVGVTEVINKQAAAASVVLRNIENIVTP